MFHLGGEPDCETIFNDSKNGLWAFTTVFFMETSGKPDAFHSFCRDRPRQPVSFIFTIQSMGNMINLYMQSYENSLLNVLLK